PADQCKLRNRSASTVHDISLQMTLDVCAPPYAFLGPWRRQCKGRGLRENGGGKRKTFLFLLTIEPRGAKPFTLFANPLNQGIFTVLLYEGIERREITHCHRRSGDRPVTDSSRPTGRGARTYGPKWLGEKHVGQGSGRPPGLSCHRWQSIDGW